MIRNSMIASITLALTGAAAALSATPAMAKPVAVETAVAAAAASRQPSLDDRICVTDTYTGSRIPRTICRTRGEFIATWGVDPTVKN